MAVLSIDINGRSYSVACEDGQEERLQDLASTLDREVRSLVAAVGHLDESRLLVITGLALVDRLNDETVARGKADGAAAGLAEAESRAAAAETDAAVLRERIADLEAQLTETARRIDAAAAEMEAD